ncbi:glycosyltransferase family 4 protein [Kribbella sp. NPDC058245]|uniref:glycosyltransferase family 4 protein n=1 Tax=Kribbella sp. NPDC058245 TaxID=3346399 RepID=UPI0036E67C0D
MTDRIAPHVAMVVANDTANDTRVLKEADALARGGVRVTLFGVAREGPATVERLDNGVLRVLVEGRFVLRDERTRRRALRRARRLMTGEPAAALAARSARINARLGDLKAESGHAVRSRKAGQVGTVPFKIGVAGRLLAQKRWQVARLSVKARTRLARRQSRWANGYWQRWDASMSRDDRSVSWRTEIPEAYDYEAMLGPVLDRIEPAAIHAHDMHIIGVAARAAGRASLRGREVKTVYDAHEYVPGLSQYGGRTPRFIAAWAQHESEYIRQMDRVITVSPAIARALRKRHDLPLEPTVVMNSPALAAGSGADAAVTGIRERIGLPDTTPLMVYSGGITRARGVETAIEALPDLPDVHLAVVCVPKVDMRSVTALKKLAAKVGVEHRVHYLEPVAPADVVPFLRTADIGLIPILRFPSHEMALPNKVFEYLFAGLPVVTSDMPSLHEFVGRTGIGEVFTAEDPYDLAVAVRQVLATQAGYRENVARPDLLREVSWEVQSDHLRALYAELLGTDLEQQVPVEDDRWEKEIRTILGL